VQEEEMMKQEKKENAHFVNTFKDKGKIMKIEDLKNEVIKGPT